MPIDRFSRLTLGTNLIGTDQGDGELLIDATGGVVSVSKTGDAELTGDVTFSEGAGIALFQSGQDIEIAASGGSAWTEVIKGSDESVTSNTTVQDDDELFFTAVSAAVYDLELFLIYVCPGGGTSDIKLDFGEDTTARGMITQTATYSTADGVNGASSILINRTAVFSLGANTDLRVLRAFGWCVGNGGTFRVRWAQNTSSGNAVTVKEGSVLRYRRII